MSLRSAATMFSRLGAPGLRADALSSWLDAPGLLAGAVGCPMGTPGRLAASAVPAASPGLGAGSCPALGAAAAVVREEEASALAAVAARVLGRPLTWLPELPGRLPVCCRGTEH